MKRFAGFTICLLVANTAFGVNITDVRASAKRDLDSALQRLSELRQKIEKEKQRRRQERKSPFRSSNLTPNIVILALVQAKGPHLRRQPPAPCLKPEPFPLLFRARTVHEQLPADPAAG